ncbi:MAG: DNA-processing protein DprA [Campylobacterota bacterium]
MAIKQARFSIDKLQSMQKPPRQLYYIGDTGLLKRPAVAIVGARKANQYAKQTTFSLAAALAKRGTCIISGAAMGIDAMAHRGAGAKNTIAVVANGLDIRYPRVNASLIKAIENEGLVMSQFEEGFEARPWSFPVRNELVVALADAVVLAQADENSGTMISAKLAMQQGKPLYVLPHRLGQSKGTQQLVKRGEAELIYDLEEFAALFGSDDMAGNADDALLECAKANPTYEELVQRFGDKVFEYEFEGKIAVKEGRVVTL